MSWTVYNYEDSVHVIPDDDVNLHVIDENCMCNPKIEYNNMRTSLMYERKLVVHSSFDGREMNE